MKLIQYPRADPFSMVRKSLTDLLEGDHLGALILHNIARTSETILIHEGIEKLDISQPGPWIWHSDRDIAMLLVPYRGKPLYGGKAIREALAGLVAKRYINMRSDPENKLSRRRQVRLACPARLQQELDDWAKLHPSYEFGPSDLAVPFRQMFDGPLPTASSTQKK